MIKAYILDSHMAFIRFSPSKSLDWIVDEETVPSPLKKNQLPFFVLFFNIYLWNVYNLQSSEFCYHDAMLSFSKKKTNKKYSWSFKIGAVRIWGRSTKAVLVSIFPIWNPTLFFIFYVFIHNPRSVSSALKWFVLIDFVFIFAAVLF